MPIWAITILVHLATNIIDYAFGRMEHMCPEGQERILDTCKKITHRITEEKT